MTAYQSEVRYNSITISDETEWDVIETDSLETLVLYEDMTAPCITARLLIRDAGSRGDNIGIGRTTVDIDVSNPDADSSPSIPTLYVYQITELFNNQLPAIKYYELACVSLDYMQQQSAVTHLQLTDEDIEGEEWMIPVHEYVERLHYSHNTEGAGNQSQMGYALDINETFNSIWYRPKAERSADALRKDEELTIGKLIEQAAENAVDASNPNAVNFFYWQNFENWNFKSIEQLSKQSVEKTFSAAPAIAASEDSEASKIIQRIIKPPTSTTLNEMDLLDSGALFSTMVYSVPKINAEAYKQWIVTNVETYYYRVNCNIRTNFPAALIGFKMIEDAVADSGNPYRWHYAFAEVYFEWNIETKTPTWKIKPMDQNPIRSTIEYVERQPDESWDASINDTGEWFHEPAHNLIEFGNDGKYDPDERKGWEAPGFRTDTMLWEQSCMKLQPIRGSLPVPDTEVLNSTEEALESDVQDDYDCTNKFPIVDMQIYWDSNDDEETGSKPHYFFSAANQTDGECEEDSELGNEGDCERP